MGPLFRPPSFRWPPVWPPGYAFEKNQVDLVKVSPPKSHIPLPGIESFLQPLGDRKINTLELKPAPEKGLAWYHAIPVEERYRLLVDEKLLKTEKGAEAFENREPGCLRGGASMYEYITAQLPHIRNAEALVKESYLKALHRALFDTIRKPGRSSKNTKKLRSTGEFRKKKVFFRVKYNYTNRGLHQAEAFWHSISAQKETLDKPDTVSKDIKRHQTGTDKPFHVDEYATNSELARKVVNRIKPHAGELAKYVKNDKFTVDFAPIHCSDVESAISALLSGYQKKFDLVTDEKSLFLLLSELASKIDQIHPFEDGNIRVIRGLIDSILMYYPKLIS